MDNEIEIGPCKGVNRACISPFFGTPVPQIRALVLIYKVQHDPEYAIARFFRLWEAMVMQHFVQQPYGNHVPKPQKYVNNSPKPTITAIKAIILHTFGVQVVAFCSWNYHRPLTLTGFGVYPP